MTHDATQETKEEWLRRIHLKDKLEMEWNKSDEEKEEKNKISKKETNLCKI